MTDNEDNGELAAELKRVPAGLPGLDAVLFGGFFVGGVYMVMGQPGAGKTILGNQIAFRHAAGGGRALFVTLLSESHARLIASMQTLEFFDPACVGTTLSYVSAYQALREEKLTGMFALLRRCIRDHKATLLVIDGFVTAGSLAEGEIATKEFIHELQIYVSLVGCTTLLLTGLTGANNPAEQYALRTMVDGLVVLHLDSIGMEIARTIEVRKLRGSNMLSGRHLFDISHTGISVYPRTESYRGHARRRPDPTPVPLADFGIDGLDAMLGGGLGSGSTTMVLGSPGSGKTLLGLSFLAAGATHGHKGLYFGFFEPEADVRRKGAGIGIPLGEGQGGRIDVMCRSPLDAIADKLAESLLAAVRDQGVRCLFIDGLGGFRDSLLLPQRSRRFFNALFSELRSLGVVTVLSDEARSVGDIELPQLGLTALLDNVITLRHAKLGSRFYKLIAVMKMREGVGDPSTREFSIGPRGFLVSLDSKSAEAAMAAATRNGHEARVRPAIKKRRKRQTR